MAVRQRKPEEMGPAVPRWVVDFREDDWPDYGAWQRAVLDWADGHLSGREHLGAWMDICSNALRLRGHRGA
ncbi:hypothetical protein GCM10011374_38680 [Kocuria dechangensis]|uniref:Uncharacterized protein n=1 Tax=Kocuria dechangensis TaxID=1176249 RepID=A0A917M1F0_9MICC|nr:hypothetical protein GCM10011374_38680 [Kocuria dechangensis]